MYYDKYYYSVNHIKNYKCYQSNMMYTLNSHCYISNLSNKTMVLISSFTIWHVYCAV